MDHLQMEGNKGADEKKNILEFLEETSHKYPDKAAVDDGKTRFNWRELNDLSKKMGTLFAKECKVRQPIVLLAEKSAWTLAAMLGTVYAGCFYVMIDPSQPAERIRNILHILEPSLVVLDEKNEALLRESGYKQKYYFLKQALQAETDQERLDQIRKESRETDLLYGIFTSGSTGMPKGIVVSHKAVIDFIKHFTDILGFESNDKIGNQAPFDFDVSVKDIYTCIMTGAELVLIPKELFSLPKALIDYLCEKNITVLIWAVSALTLVAALKGLDYKAPKNIRKICFSGEVMPVKQLRIWQKALPGADFINLYGPTEITCNCTYYPVDRIYQDGEKLPIGKPFPGRKVFLMDESGNDVTLSDVVGEICVAGESLSEGYYRNPEETNKRFMMHAMSGGEIARIYRTGDLGYYGNDDQLYFSGRKDFQIKHMGHRIELEEIECTLEQIDGVERSCCLMDERSKKLTAFYLGEADPAEIRGYLKKHFPVYMIPHRIRKTEKMPLNKNGKTDRNYFRQRMEVEI